MTSIGYVRALRARWFPLVAITLVVMCLVLLAPPAPRAFYTATTDLKSAASEAHTRYRTTAVLGVPPQAGNTESQLKTISYYLRSSDVQTAFANEIGYTGTDRGLLSRLVSVVVVPAQGSINVSGYGGSPEQSLTITDGFVTALNNYLAGIKAASTARALTTAQDAVDGLKAQIETLAGEIQTQRAADIAAAEADPATDPDAAVPVSPQLQLLEAQRDSLGASYASAFANLTKLSNAAGSPVTAQLSVLTPATAASALEVQPSLIYRLPIRIALGLLVGLLFGAATALILEHFSRKITNRDVAERAFRSRVLTEVPKRRIAGSLKDIAIVSAPTSATAAAYRMLRAVLVADQSSTGYGAGRLIGVPGAALPGRARAESALHRTEVFGRAAPGAATEGARRTVALEERSAVSARDSHTNGSSVVVASGDGLRADRGELAARPELRPGAVFVLVAPADEPVLPVVVANLAASFAEVGSDVIVLRLGPAGSSFAADGEGSGQDVWARETAVAGVQSVEWEPGPDTAAAVDVVEALRAEGAVVIVDAGRAATAEFAEVAPLADAILAVCEYGVTRIDEADRSADIIAWSQGVFRGVVLAQVPPTRRFLRWNHRRSSPLGQYERMDAA